ncbi:hypothetical protein AAFF_G00312680 [Aldrovandia affinis]|uniref:Uncharacterized protein n=1 Tax=Aldrovandia affinis TaxID=143900 RepID=A0AAD7SQC2_9TELE|nr:hypothetical protein AAFF_G00312680 [Aldrovandia affinis]
MLRAPAAQRKKRKRMGADHGGLCIVTAWAEWGPTRYRPAPQNEEQQTSGGWDYATSGRGTHGAGILFLQEEAERCQHTAGPMPTHLWHSSHGWHQWLVSIATDHLTHDCST